jgi:molybdopterin synthase catalytic subunit
MAIPVPAAGDRWCALTTDELPVGDVYDWAVLPNCGAVVLFSGTVRDHAEGRSGVSLLEYEAYESQVVPKLEAIEAEARRRWPNLGRFALIHRVGPLKLEESSVLVVASTPHRPEAFEAARFGIDTLKATVPIWKREHHAEGTDWGVCATDIETIESMSRMPIAEHATSAPGNTNTTQDSNETHSMDHDSSRRAFL